MPRLPDILTVESMDGYGVMDRFTSFSVSNDLTEPSEASIEIGDDATWPDFEDIVRPGRQYRVFLNDQLRLTGRVEVEDTPSDADGGSSTRFTVRTKLGDARYSTADPAVNVKKTSIKDFLLELYAPFGYGDEDFVFEQNVARDLLTGASSSGGDETVNLDPMTAQDAKVNPPETVFDAADRHLRRHGLMHWDAPDGRIVVGSPNDTQDPKYFLRYSRGGDTGLNNVLSATRTKDYSGIPTTVLVHGRGGIRGKARTPISSVAMDNDVVEAGFYRPVVIVAEGIKQQSLADRAAARELAARSKNKDSYVFEIDGLTHWNGHNGIPWGIDTVASVESDVANVQGGAYYIHRVALSRDADSGDRANITAVRRGIWTI